MGCGFSGSGDLGLCSSCTRKYNAMPPERRPDLSAAQHAAAKADAAAAVAAKAAALRGSLIGVVGGSVADVRAVYFVKPAEEGQSPEQVELQPGCHCHCNVTAAATQSAVVTQVLSLRRQISTDIGHPCPCQVEQNVADFHQLLLESPLPALHSHMEPLCDGSTVSVWVGDITALNVDAIVNAAQETLTGGGGIDGAIHRAAGPGLKEECLTLPGDLSTASVDSICQQLSEAQGVDRQELDRARAELRLSSSDGLRVTKEDFDKHFDKHDPLVKEHIWNHATRCPTGQARITAGHGLPARHVIHTVGPYMDDHGEMQPALVKSCYRKSLQLAGEHRLSSVALPLISVGFYGHSEACVMRCMLAESRAFLEHRQAEGAPPMEITAVLFPGVGNTTDAVAEPAPELATQPRSHSGVVSGGRRMYQEHMFMLLRDQYFPPAELLSGIAPEATRALVKRMRAVPAGARPTVGTQSRQCMCCVCIYDGAQSCFDSQVLLMTGGLCPVHSGHLQAMLDATAGLRAAGLHVVGGALSPSCDGYVSGKRAAIIPHSQRCALVDGGGADMAGSEGEGFLFADRWEGRQKTFESFTAVARSLAGRLSQLAEKHAVAAPVVCYVAGSDNAGFALAFEGEADLACAVVCRPGASGSDVSDSAARALGASPNMYLIDGQGMDMSSTELLRVVAAGATAAALANFVPPSVARWLVEESPYRPCHRLTDMSLSWFSDLFGVGAEGAEGAEGGRCDYSAVQSAFATDGQTLRCLESGRAFDMGAFTCPSLAELREAAATAATPATKLSVSHVATEDIGKDHTADANNGALIQAASQFNCLEMTSDRVSPEAGITGVAADATQGPSCALATAPALLFRNYLVPIQRGGGLLLASVDEANCAASPTPLPARGQTSDRQIDNTCGMADLLSERFGEQFWTLRNGYLRSDAERLARLSALLQDESLREELKARLRIGITWSAEVEVLFIHARQTFVLPSSLFNLCFSTINRLLLGGRWSAPAPARPNVSRRRGALPCPRAPWATATSARGPGGARRRTGSPWPGWCLRRRTRLRCSPV